MYFKTVPGKPRPYVMKLPDMFNERVFLNGWGSVVQPVECFTYTSTCVVVVSFVICFPPGGVSSEDEVILQNLMRHAAEWFDQTEKWEHTSPADCVSNVDTFVCRRNRILFDLGGDRDTGDVTSLTPTAADLCDGLNAGAASDVIFAWSRGVASRAHPTPVPVVEHQKTDAALSDAAQNEFSSSSSVLPPFIKHGGTVASCAVSEERDRSGVVRSESGGGGGTAVSVPWRVIDTRAYGNETGSDTETPREVVPSFLESPHVVVVTAAPDVGPAWRPTPALIAPPAVLPPHPLISPPAMLPPHPVIPPPAVLPPPPGVPVPINVSFFNATCRSAALNLRTRFRNIQRQHVERNEKPVAAPEEFRDYTAMTVEELVEMLNFQTANDGSAVAGGDGDGGYNLFGF
jgi:hypothetical protein